MRGLFSNIGHSETTYALGHNGPRDVFRVARDVSLISNAITVILDLERYRNNFED